MKSINRYYYNNILSNQNETAKNNIVWAADITSISLSTQRKLYLFLCIDIHTNLIINFSVSTRVFDSKRITQNLSSVISKRLKKKPKIKVILHTDRGTQFTSQNYHNFVQKYKDYIIPSMSRDSTPIDNSVCERFMRTFKEIKIEGYILEDALKQQISINPEYKTFRSLVSKYVTYLNVKPNRKTNGYSPDSKDKNVSFASKLMLQPQYTKAFSKRFGDDPRLLSVEQFQKENQEILQYIEEVARKVDVVDQTPFDYETVLSNRLINKQIEELKNLIESNSKITEEYVLCALNPIEESLNQLHQKINRLLPREKKVHQTQKLRDPLNKELFPIFLSNAGSSFKYKSELRKAQLRVCYTILYHVGLRVNELRCIKESDIQDAINTAQFSLVHYKVKQAYNHVITNKAVLDLKNLKEELEIIFRKNGYKYLFGKSKPIHQKSLIRIVNQDLKKTCEVSNLSYTIKSHSFRINLITNLLRVTTLHDTASIIGHQDIRSTLRYKRYALSKSEIQSLLEKIQEFN